MSASSAATLVAIAASAGVAIYLLAQVPVFFVACGIVAFLAVLLAVLGDARADDTPGPGPS